MAALMSAGSSSRVHPPADVAQAAALAPHLSASSRQPRMGGHVMGAHFNVAMRALQHIQLYTYHVHGLSKCVLAWNGRFRW